jgi:hypothetical protein
MFVVLMNFDIRTILKMQNQMTIARFSDYLNQTEMLVVRLDRKSVVCIFSLNLLSTRSSDQSDGGVDGCHHRHLYVVSLYIVMRIQGSS